MTKLVDLIVHYKSGAPRNTLATVAVGAPNGKPLVIKVSQDMGSFELTEVASKVAPNQVLIRRVGKNLHLHLAADGASADLEEEPTLVLEDYVTAGSALSLIHI